MGSRLQGSKGSTLQGGSARLQGFNVGGSTFTPLDFGDNLILWLDATDASTITLNGSDVSQWDDKSGNANNLVQATAADQPVYTTGVSVDFDGVSEFLGKSTGSFSNVTVPFFVVVVLSATSQTAGDGIYDIRTGTRPQLTQVGSPADDYKIFNGNFVTSVSNVSTGAVHSIGISFVSGNNTSLYISGVVDGTIDDADAGNGTIDGLILAAINGGAGGWADIKVKEFIILDKIPTTAEHNELGNYQASKYSFSWTNIP